MSLPRLSNREKHLLVKALAYAVVAIESKGPDASYCGQEVRGILAKLTHGEGEAEAYIAMAARAAAPPHDITDAAAR